MMRLRALPQRAFASINYALDWRPHVSHAHRRRRCTAEIAVYGIRMAIVRQRAAQGLIHHFDRGIHYAADTNRRILFAAGMTPP